MRAVRVVVDNRLRVERASEISGRAEGDLRAEFTHPNPEHERWSSHSIEVRRWKSEPAKTIATWRREDGDVLSLPRGGAERLREILRGHGITPRFIDLRSRGAANLGFYMRAHSRVLFDYQEDMVQAAMGSENCILRAPCGGGKTSVGIAIASRVCVSTLVVVPSTRIFDEWDKRLQEELDLSPGEIGWYGRGRKRIRPITVATVDALRRDVEKLAPLFGCVIFDEVHRAPANSYYPAIDALPCKYRIGISADERRKDRKHGINYDLFGKVVVDVPQQTLIDQGVVLPVAVRLIPTDFDAPWYVALPDARKRDPNAYRQLLDEMVADDARTALAVGFAAQEVRLRPTLVFSHRIEHCKRMRADIIALDGYRHLVGVVLGEKIYQAESDTTVAGLQAGTYRCGVGTYQSIGTGVDLPAVESGVAVTPILANQQNFVQIRDRLCRVDRRPGATKRSATLYVLWDRKVLGERPLRNALAWSRGTVEVLDEARYEYAGVAAPTWVDGREYLRRADDYSLI